MKGNLWKTWKYTIGSFSDEKTAEYDNIVAILRTLLLLVNLITCFFIMSNIGLQTETAFAISIVFGFVLILIGLPGSMIWLLNKFEFKIPFKDSND